LSSCRNPRPWPWTCTTRPPPSSIKGAAAPEALFSPKP
jgi:hypothetical protein